MIPWPDPPWAPVTYAAGVVLMALVLTYVCYQALHQEHEPEPDRATKIRAVGFVIVGSLCWFVLPFVLLYFYFFENWRGESE